MKKILIFITILLMLVIWSIPTYSQGVMGDQWSWKWHEGELSAISATKQGNGVSNKFGRADTNIVNFANFSGFVDADSFRVEMVTDTIFSLSGARVTDSLGLAPIKFRAIPIMRYPPNGQYGKNNIFDTNDSLFASKGDTTGGLNPGSSFDRTMLGTVLTDSLGNVGVAYQFTHAIESPQYMFITEYNWVVADTSSISQNVKHKFYQRFTLKKEYVNTPTPDIVTRNIFHSLQLAGSGEDANGVTHKFGNADTLIVNLHEFEGYVDADSFLVVIAKDSINNGNGMPNADLSSIGLRVVPIFNDEGFSTAIILTDTLIGSFADTTGIVNLATTPHRDMIGTILEDSLLNVARAYQYNHEIETSQYMFITEYTWDDSAKVDTTAAGQYSSDNVYYNITLKK